MDAVRATKNENKMSLARNTPNPPSIQLPSITIVCKEYGITTMVTSRSATARFTYIKLVSRLVSIFLYRIYITKTFPTRASNMVAGYKIAKDTLTRMEYSSSSGEVAEDNKK